MSLRLLSSPGPAGMPVNDPLGVPVLSSMEEGWHFPRPGDGPPSTGGGRSVSRRGCSCLRCQEPGSGPQPAPYPKPAPLTIFKLRGLNELPALTRLQLHLFL